MEPTSLSHAGVILVSTIGGPADSYYLIVGTVPTSAFFRRAFRHGRLDRIHGLVPARRSMRYLWLFCLSASLWGQTFDLSYFQDGSTDLAGRWKFHAGDDPRWADPNLNDSDWKLIQVPLSLNKQGYPDFSGYSWYRITLQRLAQDSSSDLSFAVIAIRTWPNSTPTVFRLAASENFRRMLAFTILNLYRSAFLQSAGGTTVWS